MRKRLSTILVDEAKKDSKFIVLSCDHGYELFDALRQERPDQFLNCGVAEQGMIGIAAGLALQGFKPVVYGLASFIPMRVLEQIKIDICLPNLPITLIGDGAGLVYSTLGPSHQCAEDIAVLRCLPNISIYSPYDSESLEYAWKELCPGPRYIRIGKADRPSPVPVNRQCRGDIRVVTHGSMVSPVSQIAAKLGLSWVAPVQVGTPSWVSLVGFQGVKKIIVVEEHCEQGGLGSVLCESMKDVDIHIIGLKRKFSHQCGSYQYALSEHEMDDASLERRIREIVNVS